ncbi:uncharacterized protein LOC120339984 [Styela clava]|uniref:peroxisomal multifunctional enzyme type 2-like n=1 Tax=Styela clava TaxID=7725 RepID=UPI0019399943|nr:peroxisomal multifunctional enzyme type 2-like [Styela clava]
MAKFGGKVVIITGASSGIGAATAVAFSKEGAKLAICGRNKARLNETAKICKDNGSEVVEIIGDVSDFDHLQHIVNTTVGHFKGIDILINNAGIGSYSSIVDLEVKHYEKLFRTNLLAAVFLCKYAFPYLKQSKGCVVNVSSILGLRTMPILKSVPYGMLKSALDYFTRGFAAECLECGIRVNSINPGPVMTRIRPEQPITKDEGVKIRKFMKERAMPGYMQPIVIADGILYLCSSRHITGICLPIDAGVLSKLFISTGAASGIGAATAIEFAKEGANLSICDKEKAGLANTAKACRDAGVEVFEIVVDLSEFENLGTVISKTVEKFSSIDILVNNAGRGLFGYIADMELEDFELLYRTNLRAPVFLCKFALPHLKKTKGCVVNVSSLLGLRHFNATRKVHYGMLKCALDHFTRGFAAECSPFGIRVNSVNPGTVVTNNEANTEIRTVPEDILEKSKADFEKLQPFGFMEPKTIADGILFLCSSPHITGISLPIESGALVS